MSSTARPIYLFADSQLLFWKNDGRLFLNAIADSLPNATSAKAAYIGASNGDDPQFYQIFELAMEGIGILTCRMIPSSFSPADKAFIEEADVILLAGGDIEKGWNVFQSTGLVELLITKYNAGATLVGISAGAVQLGLAGWKEDFSPETVFPTLKLLPYVIGVHEEKTEWATLKKVISVQEPYTRGIGIPAGGGMIYHADATVEPIRHALREIFQTDQQLSHVLLFPKS